MMRGEWSLSGIIVSILILTASCGANAATVVRAVAGSPFGFGEVAFDLPAGDERMWQCRSMRIVEPTGRLVYPVLEFPGLLQRMASRIDGDKLAAPPRATFAFMFTGNEPLTLEIHGSRKQTITVTPEYNRPLKHARLARMWWKHVWGPLNERVEENGRPRPVENYLAGMGIWRLGINRHPSVRPFQLMDIHQQALGAVASRPEMARAVAFGHCSRELADLPVPTDGVDWVMPFTSLPVGEPRIEEIATRVPQDCFYIRFGKYSNMLWVTRLLEAKGEELLRLVTLNGFRSDANARIQSQLAIKELPMADLIGDRLIGDVALIGKDMFVGDGAAIGVIIRSKGKVLDQGLLAQRKEALQKFKKHGATEQTLEMSGEEVSFISTPDNRLRTFHLQDGDFHLVTNCRRIVEDFISTRDGESLATLTPFRQLREVMPFKRTDTVSVYVSAEYMRGLAQPERLIELMRRVRSREELALLEVAKRTALVEEKAAVAGGRTQLLLDPDQDLVPQLAALNLLPPRFGERADGTRAIWQGDRFIDSLRGAVGSFTPIPDVKVESATAQEVAAYRKFEKLHVRRRALLDPFSVRIRRKKGRKGNDELEIDAKVYPIHSDSMRFAGSFIGKPKGERTTIDENALVSIEMVVNGAVNGVQEDNSVQLTLLDGDPLPVKSPMRFSDYLELAKKAPLYLKAYPGRRVFPNTWWQPAPTPTKEMFFNGPFDLVGLRHEDYSAVGFNRELIANLPPKIVRERTDQPGSLWVHIGDLKGSTLQNLVKASAAELALRGSVLNVQRFHRWTQLLGMEAAEGPDLVSRLVGMQPVCPLDGRYEFTESPEGGMWQSTAWAESSLNAAKLENYDPALMEWWHGLELELSLDESGLHARALVKVAFDMDDEKSMPSLPFFSVPKKRSSKP